MMKRLSAFLAIAFFAGTVSVFAQTQPKTAAKPVAKKECKKGDACCSGKAKTAETASTSAKAPVKKN